MPHQPDFSHPVDTAALRRRVARWQSSRAGRARIPAPLRTQVLALAAQVGVYRAAADLGLSYSTLKRWSDAEPPQPEAAGGEAPAFIEWLAPSVLAQQGLECTLEIEGGRGLRVKLSVAGLDLKGLSALVRDLVV